MQGTQLLEHERCRRGESDPCWGFKVRAIPCGPEELIDNFTYVPSFEAEPWNVRAGVTLEMMLTARVIQQVKSMPLLFSVPLFSFWSHESGSLDKFLRAFQP